MKPSNASPFTSMTVRPVAASMISSPCFGAAAAATFVPSGLAGLEPSPGTVSAASKPAWTPNARGVALAGSRCLAGACCARSPDRLHTSFAVLTRKMPSLVAASLASRLGQS